MTAPLCRRAVLAALAFTFALPSAALAAGDWPPAVTLSIADQSALPALPVEVVLDSDVEVDLVSIDMTTPDDRRVMVFEIKDDAPRGKRFAYPLPATETATGRYYLNYALSRTNPNGSSDAMSGYVTFWIGEKPAE